MIQIGLLSDTHSNFQDSLEDFFGRCNEIWHAGDIGSLRVIDRLEKIAPVRAVYGNIDGQDIRIRFPEFLDFYIEGIRVWMIHIGGYPGRYVPKIRNKLNTERTKILITGHSHILKIMTDPHYKHLHINPGAAGNSGLHKVITAVRFKIEKGNIFDMEIFEKSRK